MGQDVRSGDVFIFLNRHCTSMKALHMEHGGLVIYYMKLEKGNLHCPRLMKRQNPPLFLAKTNADGTGY